VCVRVCLCLCVCLCVFLSVCVRADIGAQGFTLDSLVEWGTAEDMAIMVPQIGLRSKYAVVCVHLARVTQGRLWGRLQRLKQRRESLIF
jgi:hypothetical protein